MTFTRRHFINLPSFALVAFFSLHAFGAAALNSSLLMFSLEDAYNCPIHVAHFMKANARLLFLPTLYFQQDNNQLQSYCSVQEGQCVPMTDKIIAQYEEAWTSCFKMALRNGVGLSILPHLDDGDRSGAWRNEVAFDPLKKYDGYSYYEIMIAPLVRAMSKASRWSFRKVDLALMGEMGAPIFAYPESSLKILKALKKKHPFWRVGISFNYNDIDGTSGNKQPQILQGLFEAADFVGISEYHAVHSPPRVQDFFDAITDFRQQLKVLGVNLRSSKTIQFSEIAVGGGFATDTGTIPATSPEQIALQPWAGFQLHPYDQIKDPWQNPMLREFRRQFYETLLKFLSLGTSKTHVTRAFNWSNGPWNFQGYEPNVFADPFIQNEVEKHNARILRD